MNLDSKGYKTQYNLKLSKYLANLSELSIVWSICKSKMLVSIVKVLVVQKFLIILLKIQIEFINSYSSLYFKF